jgi:hypothetical protein
MAEAQFSPLYIYLHYSNAHSPICTQVCMHKPGGKIAQNEIAQVYQHSNSPKKVSNQGLITKEQCM